MTLSNIKDIVTMVVSIAAVVIAYFGLQTWKKQLLGENKYELSATVIKLLRILIEEIQSYRVGFFSVDELYIAFDEIEKRNPENEKEFEKADSYAKRLRWNKIVSAYTEYDSKLLHLKVILDKFTIDIVNNENMETYLKKLRESIYSYPRYENLLEPGVAKTKDERSKYIDELEKHSHIILRGGEKDIFTPMLENYFIEIKGRLKQYLK